MWGDVGLRQKGLTAHRFDRGRGFASGDAGCCCCSSRGFREQRGITSADGVVIGVMTDTRRASCQRLWVRGLSARATFSPSETPDQEI